MRLKQKLLLTLVAIQLNLNTMAQLGSCISLEDGNFNHVNIVSYSIIEHLCKHLLILIVQTYHSSYRH